jgi:hypothetical protein
MPERRRDRLLRAVVHLVTAETTIQAVVTASLTGVVFSFNEGVSAYLQRWFRAATGWWVPVKLVAAVGAAVILVGAVYVDQHTDEWRAFVADATGEEQAAEGKGDGTE